MSRRNHGARYVRHIFADRLLRVVVVRNGTSGYGWSLCQWFKIERAIVRATRKEEKR